jgi:dihydrofolate synthase/folylpolyglutamate synthase
MKLQKKTNSELWVDGGHNAAAGQALSKVFSKKSSLPLYLIFGMLKTKNCRDFIEPFAKHIKKVMVVEISNSNLSTTKNHLLKTATNLNIDCVAADNIRSAILKINQDNLYSSSRILICGSLYLAGDALRQSGFRIE